MRRAVAICLSLAAVIAMPAAAADHRFTVAVIPPEAGAYESVRVEVRLADVTDPAAEPQVLGGSGTFPGDFDLPREMRISFDDADVVAGRTYAVEAQVWQRSDLIFTTLEPVVIDPLATEHVDVRVDPPPPLALKDTRWIGDDFGGVVRGPDEAPLSAIISFSDTDSAVSTRFIASFGCATWIARADFAGIRLRFVDVNETTYPCPDAGLAFAAQVAEAIDATRTFELVEGALELRGAEGVLLVRLTPFEPPQ